MRLILSGNSGDSLTEHRDMPFTTRDQDNDNFISNCAIKYKGAWWYNNCHHSNLNGLYLRGSHSTYADGVNWFHWKGHYYSLKRTEMKIRPVDFWTVTFMAQQSNSTNLTKKTSVSIKYIQHYTITLKSELSETLFRVFLPSLYVFQNRNNWFCTIGHLTNNNNNNNSNNELIYLAVHTESSLS